MPRSTSIMRISARAAPVACVLGPPSELPPLCGAVYPSRDELGSAGGVTPGGLLLPKPSGQPGQWFQFIHNGVRSRQALSGAGGLAVAASLTGPEAKQLGDVG